MTDVVSQRARWALFFAGVAALLALGYGMVISHVFQGAALTVAVFVWAMVFLGYAYFGSGRLKRGRLGPVMKRYRQRLAVAMIVYFVALLSSISLLKHGGLAGPVLWLVAAAPAVPILGVLAVIGLYLKEEPDEFERAVQVESMLWGLGVVLAVSTVVGFLSTAGVLPAPPLFLTFPLFCVAWPISQVFIRRRYQ